MASTEEVNKITGAQDAELRLLVVVSRRPSGALSSSLRLLNEDSAAKFGPDAGLPEVALSLLQQALQCEARLQILKLLGEGRFLDAAQIASNVQQQVATSIEMTLAQVIEHCTREMGRIQGNEDETTSPQA